MREPAALRARLAPGDAAPEKGPGPRRQASPEGALLLERARFPELPPELVPLAWAALGEAGRRDDLSPAEQARAEALYQASAARNVLLGAERDALLDGTAGRGIELLPVKGALFADLLYCDCATRPMSDLDFLVRPGGLGGVEEILRARGFVTEPADAPHHTLWVGAADVLIELHHRLPDELDAAPDLEPVLARARTVELHGRSVRTLSAEDQFVFTAAHAASHAFGHSPLWPFDLFLLARAEPLAWPLVAAEADRRGVRRALQIALALAQAALGVPLAPAGALAAEDAPPGWRLALVNGLSGAWPRARPGKLASLAARGLLHDTLAGVGRSFTRRLAHRLTHPRE